MFDSQTVVNELDKLMSDLGREKVAADIIGDPGTTHPAEQSKEESNIQPATEGAHAAGGSALVKETVQGHAVDDANETDAAGDSFVDKVTDASQPGEDPEVEKNYTSPNKQNYPGTTHPADTNKQTDKYAFSELDSFADELITEALQIKQASLEDLTAENVIEKLANVLELNEEDVNAENKVKKADEKINETLTNYIKAASLNGELVADVIEAREARLAKEAKEAEAGKGGDKAKEVKEAAYHGSSHKDKDMPKKMPKKTAKKKDYSSDYGSMKKGNVGMDYEEEGLPPEAEMMEGEMVPPVEGGMEGGGMEGGGIAGLPPEDAAVIAQLAQVVEEISKKTGLPPEEVAQAVAEEAAGMGGGGEGGEMVTGDYAEPTDGTMVEGAPAEGEGEEAYEKMAKAKTEENEKLKKANEDLQAELTKINEDKQAAEKKAERKALIKEALSEVVAENKKAENSKDKQGG